MVWPDLDVNIPLYTHADSRAKHFVCCFESKKPGSSVAVKEAITSPSLSESINKKIARYLALTPSDAYMARTEIQGGRGSAL